MEAILSGRRIKEMRDTLNSSADALQEAITQNEPRKE